MTTWFIFVRNADDPGNTSDVPSCTWQGELGWPSVPPVGATWFHCGDWAGETISRVGFSGPEEHATNDVSIEVKAGADVITHLIADHGFTPLR
jgi:hypothetical protein